MLRWLLELDLVDGPVPWTVWALAAAGAIVLLIRPLRRRWVLRAVIAIAAGALAGWFLVVWADATMAFELPLPPTVKWWTTGGFALLGLSIVSLWRSRWWHKAVGILTVITSVLSMFLGINQAFGLDRTLGEILGVNTLASAGSFAPPLTTPAPTTPLFETWRAPEGMRQSGETRVLSGDARIPSTAGFAPRDASIYLPPAALVKDPPALPVMVLMMGLPGSPNPRAVASVLNRFAAEHQGLAPIVIVADQLGSQTQNPGCVDSKAYGGVETYVNRDIPNWIRTHLRVLPDPQHWTIAGYSNGGACAFIYGARHPEIWGNIANTSGEPWAGFADPASVLKPVYGGDEAAFEANKPAAILAEHPGAYTDHWAVFSAGALDKKYGPANRKAAALAESAGFRTTFHLIPNAPHSGPGLYGGLSEAFSVLYPRWGLAAPR